MKEAKKKDPLATKESMTVLHNVEARRQEHDALKREQGFPEEQDPNAMRYQRYAEMETDEQGKIMHNKPPWVVNEASEMIAEINDEDAPTYKKSDKARNRAGKNTASLTKDWNPFKRKPKKDDPQDRQTSLGQEKIAEDFVARQKELRSPEHLASKKRELEQNLKGESSFSVAPGLKEKYPDDKFLQGLPATPVKPDLSSKESIEAHNTAARKNIAEKNLPKVPEKAVTKALFNSEGQNYGGVIAPQRYAIVEKAHGEHDKELARGKPADMSAKDWELHRKNLDRQNVMSDVEEVETTIGEHFPVKESYSPRQAERHGGLDTLMDMHDAGKDISRRLPAQEASARGGTHDSTLASPETKQRIKDAGLEYAPKAYMGKLTKALIKLYDDAPKSPNTPVTRTVTNPNTGLPEKRTARYNPFTGDLLEGAAPFDQPESSDEKAKRKSGTGLTPTSVLEPDYPASESGRMGQGKQTRSKRYPIEDMEKGAGSDRSMGWQKRRTRADDIAKDPTMAYRSEEPEYDPEGAASQMTRSPGNVKGEGDKKKEEMINNYIASLNKAGVGAGGPTSYGGVISGNIKEGGSLYKPTQEEQEDWEREGSREQKNPAAFDRKELPSEDLSDLKDPKTGKWKEGIKLENFLLGGVGRAAVGGALAGGGDDEIEMTEKAGFGSGGHARDQQRQFNRMSSGQKKRYGGMGAMGFAPAASKNKSKRGTKK